MKLSLFDVSDAVVVECKYQQPTRLHPMDTAKRRRPIRAAEHTNDDDDDDRKLIIDGCLECERIVGDGGITRDVDVDTGRASH